MLDARFAALLARTYHHRVSAFRPLSGGGEETVCLAQPCALSRAAMVTAPEPSAMMARLPEADYRMSLFTRPERTFRLGDRLEIVDEQGRTLRGRASDSFCYSSHAVTVVEILEITGQDSRESGTEEEAEE